MKKKISSLLEQHNDKTVPIQARVREHLYHAVRKLMDENGVTWNELINASIVVYLEENNIKTKQGK